MKNVIKLVVLFIIILLIFNISRFSYAKVEGITQDSLKQKIENYEKSELNRNNYKFEVTEDTIKLTTEEDEFEIKYNLNGEPTFITEVSFSSGYSFDKYQKESVAYLYPLFGYMAIANINGISDNNSLFYAANFYNNEMEKATKKLEEKYIVVDSEEEIPKEPNDGKIYVTNENFGEHLLEYLEDLCTIVNPLKISDTNTFELEIKTVATNLMITTVETKLTIKENADFSKISEQDFKLSNEKLTLNEGEIKNITANNIVTKWISSNEKVAKVDSKGNIEGISAGKATITAIDFIGNLQTIDVTINKNSNVNTNNSVSTDNKINNTNNLIRNNVDNTVANKILPKAGFNKVILTGFILFIVIAIIIMFYLNIKYRDIK